MYEAETTTNFPPITMAIIPPIEYTIDLDIDTSLVLTITSAFIEIEVHLMQYFWIFVLMH
jgi:hypothetical protein